MGVRRGDVAEGEAPLVEHRPELIGGRKSGGLGEDLAVMLRLYAVEHAGEHEDGVQRQALGVHRREVGRVLRHDGRDLAVDSGAGEGGRDIRAAGGVEDHIEAAPAGQALHVIVNAFFTVVDGLVRAHATGDIGLGGRGNRGRHPRALGPGELDGDMADAARAAVNEHMIARGDAGAVDERFPGGDGHQRQRGGLAPVEGVGLEGHEGGIDRDVFTVGAAVAAHAGSTAVDGVAGREASHAVADGFDHAGHVAAEHRRQFGRDRRPGGAQLGVDRIDARRDLAHQQLARARAGRVDLGGFEDVRGAEGANELNLHDTTRGNDAPTIRHPLPRNRPALGGGRRSR